LAFSREAQNDHIIYDQQREYLTRMPPQDSVPASALTKSPIEMEQLQMKQIDRMAARLSEDLRPALDNVMAQKNLVTDAFRRDEERIQQLNVDLQDTHAAAEDALKLTHYLSNLYVHSFDDNGVIVRLLTLPANLLDDSVRLNLVNSRDRVKVSRELSQKMNAIELRLNNLQDKTAPGRT
jgi:hypothetical protein